LNKNNDDLSLTVENELGRTVSVTTDGFITDISDLEGRILEKTAP
jgi:hypothetical protein